VPLTVASWNLFNHPPTWSGRLAAILATLRELKADVLILQELPSGRGTEFTFARALEFAAATSVPFLRPDDGWAETLAVLSRHPILESEPLELRPGVPNALRVRVAGPAGPLDVFNVHFHPRDQDLRVREAAVIAASRSAGFGVPAIIGGDFNARPDNPLFGELAGFVSAYRAVHGTEPELTFATPLRTDLDPRPHAVLDHVLVEPAQATVVAAHRFGDRHDGVWPSDHWGIAARLEVQTS
jgi:endonuclease/exonuclease/phosphatase family metal-dependent hydrolase